MSVIRDWYKSSFSQIDKPNCVEVQFADGLAFLRDGKDPAGPVLMFNRGEWDAFELGMARGEFSMPDE